MGKLISKPDLVSYPNAGKKGIKVFSDTEIKRVPGFERLYRIFWNKKAEEICTDKVLCKWTKTAIQGVIATEWTLKKTPLLFSHAVKLLDAAYHDQQRQKKGTVKSGMLSMLDAHKGLLGLDQKLRKLKNPTNTERRKKEKMANCEEEMKGKLTELKKRQEALRKSLENMSREKGVKNTEIAETLEVSTTQLESSSIERLIQEIMPEGAEDIGPYEIPDEGHTTLVEEDEEEEEEKEEDGDEEGECGPKPKRARQM